MFRGEYSNSTRLDNNFFYTGKLRILDSRLCIVFYWKINVKTINNRKNTNISDKNTRKVILDSLNLVHVSNCEQGKVCTKEKLKLLENLFRVQCKILDQFLVFDLFLNTWHLLNIRILNSTQLEIKNNTRPTLYINTSYNTIQARNR